MLRLLLDANFSPRVTAEVRHHRPDCPIADLHEWEGGRYLEESDDAVILEAAASQGFTLVTRDIRTIEPMLARRRRVGLSHAGVVFVHSNHFPEGNIGAVVRALMSLWQRYHNMDLRDQELYLQPIPKE